MKRKINLLDAIISLVPGAEVSAVGEDITWHKPEVAPVTIKQIKKEMKRLSEIQENYIPPNPPNWREFLSELRQTEVFSLIKEQSRSDIQINGIFTELRINLGEAALGVSNNEEVQDILYELVSVLTTEQISEIQSLIEKYNIPLQTEHKKVRARNSDGTFIADDPSTPDVDEAWETK